MNGISFCIITDFRRPEKLAHQIESIRALGIPDYEIRVAVDGPRTGYLGRLRNQAASGARFDVLVITDDDVYFHDDFYTGLLEYGDDWDILLPRLLNPDGSRLFDWCTFGGPTGHHMRPYGTPDDGYAVPTGGVIILRQAVFERVRYSESMKFYEGIGEDYDYGQRLHAAGYVLKSNPLSTLTHDDPTYYSPDGLIVLRRPA